MKFQLGTDDREINLSFNENDKAFKNERSINVLSSQNDVSLCTQQKLELSSWGLPEKIFEFYRTKGIRRMFPWQLECLTLGRVLDAGNLVYSAPTSAGKTLVAEILISKTIFEMHKKVLVILPFVSIVREKMFYFKEMYASSGIHVEGYMGGHTPSICFKQVHLAVCTIEKANSIINRLLEEQSLTNLGLVVVDELHLLGDPYRGYLLELLLTKLKYISSKFEHKIQIVGMSATLPNLKSLADWLNADLYYTDYRPVPLNEKLKCGSIMFDKKLNKLSELTPLLNEGLEDSENVGQLCLETITNGHSVLIFCPTKIWCENLAEKIALFLKKIGCSKSAETEGTLGWALRKELNLKNISEVIEHLKMSPVGLDKALESTIAFGVAFHHAGLTLDERDIIEGSFKKGSIRVLCATSTLSSGVNLPARRVIIRSPMSFGGLMDILTYRQMIGRAGRMGVDSEGESILICKPNEKVMCQTLMCSNLKPIESCLGHGRLSASLKRALLEILASGITRTPEEIKEYASCTFLAYSSKHDIEDPIQSCLEFLKENEFVRFEEKEKVYVPTPLAKACLVSSLPPDEGLALFRELQRARRCFVLDTDLHIIYQVTPYSVSEQWSKIDWLNVLNILEGLPASMRRVGDMVGVEEGFLVRVVKGTLNPNVAEIRNKLSIHRRFYTSLALQDLINEMPLSKVAEKYDCNKGMLQSLQQSAATYAGMVTEFTKCLGWNSVELIFSQFQERLQFGIQRELCELMRLPLLNAMRARALFNAGFTNLPDIASANSIDLENVFYKMAPFQSKKEIAGETTYEKNQRNKLEAVWITGRADLSVRETVKLLISESRRILEMELGMTVKWEENHADASLSHKTESKLEIDKHKLVENLEKSVSKLDKSNVTVENKSEETPEVKASENISALDVGANKSDSKVPEESVGEESQNLPDKSTQKTINDCQVKEVPPSDDIFTKAFDTESFSEVAEKHSLTTNVKNTELNAEHKSIIEMEKEIYYFSSFFNVDIVPEQISEVICHANNDKSKNDDFILDESDSNGSVEILYDSTIHNGTKNFSLSRLSDDMFEMPVKGKTSIKNMSTPIASRGAKTLAELERSQNRLAETRSPDLFSQSLTFDTQIGKILDFEKDCAEDGSLIINPSSSINSDDLGFVSDLSPQKPKKVENPEQTDGKKYDQLELQKAGITASLLENEFKASMESKEKNALETTKRKISAMDSPDLIGSCKSDAECQNPAKRMKYNAEDNTSSPRKNESDDEITDTPKLDKSHLANISVITKLRNTFLKRDTQNADQKSSIFQKRINSFKSNGVGGKCKKQVVFGCDKTKWDRINIIDVCKEESEFRSFIEQLKEQSVIGLALGCQRIEENRPTIGMKITKRKKSERTKDKPNCHHKNTLLDGIAFYWKDNDVFYMSLNDEKVPTADKIALLRILNRKEVTLRVYDTKEQIKMLYRFCSLLLSSSFQDPKVASWLESETWKEKNFTAVALEFLPKCATLVSQIGTTAGNSSPGLFTRSSTSAKTRACVEAFVTFHLINQQQTLLLRKGLTKAFEQSEMPVMLCLAEIELQGFEVNKTALENISEKLNSAQTSVEEMIYSHAQFKFSISSASAVSKVLAGVLHLGEDSNTSAKKKKLPSTSKEALEKLARETKHPLPELILLWRKIRFVITKFVSPLVLATMESAKVFAVSQTFTLTGRISMHEPNLQNVPKKFVVGLQDQEKVVINFREIFVASSECLLISVDYRQLELRMLAHLSQDSDLMNNIKDSSDIFVNIAADIFGVPHHDVDETLRQRAKQTCYGMIYGIGAQNLGEQLEINESDAADLIQNFKTKYKGVTNYLENLLSECRKKGYVTTLLNRRRYLPAINDSNQAVRKEAERQAVNTTIQGSAADLVKTAMVVCREKLSNAFSSEITARMVLHLHDELIFEVSKNAVETVALILTSALENAMDLTVATPIKIKVGPSWGQLKDFEI